MRKRNYSKLMGIAAATLSAAVIASPMTAHAEDTNENTGVASESGSGASSSEGTSSESGSGASSSEGTSSESNVSGAASSSTEGTTASATESGASTSASSTEGATTTESTSTTSTGTTSSETTGTAATGTSSTESTGTTTTESTGTSTGATSTESTGTTTSESTGTSTATTVAPNGTTTSAPIAAEGNTSANMESTGTTVKAESTSSTTTNSDGSVTETVTTTTTTTEVKDPVFTTTDVQPGTADYDHIQTDADGNPVKDPNGDVIHPITKTEATQGTTTTVSTTTTSTTTKTETTTTTTMTNAEDWDYKKTHTLDKDGHLIDADTTLDKDTKDYLNSQNVTADFDVYANTMDKTCGHIDGNIAVNRLNESTTLMNKENQYGTNRVTTSETNLSGTAVDKLYAQNGYSYVGSVADGVYISTSSNQKTGNVNDSLLVTGSDVTNTDAKGDANHFKSVTLTPGATVDGKVTEAAHQEALKQEARLKNLREVSDIKNNLADIASKGQKVIDDITAQTGTSNLTNLQKLQKIGTLLEQGMLTDQDIITVTIGAAVLGDNNNATEGDNNDIEAALSKLVSANTQGANIVLNVVVGDQDVSVSTTGTQVFSVKRHLQNGYKAYDARAAYLNWNFGNFAGRIDINSTFSGNVIAPNAYLHAGNGLQSGRVVSDTASSGGELHHAIKGQIHEVTVKNVIVVSKESKTQSESITPNTNSWVFYTYPTFPTTPETPETPETPKTPETPETPKTPETPETPEMPETPSHHESHDDDDRDDPSRDIQYFTEDPHVLGVSREREIPISYMPFIEEGHVLGESRPKNPVENVLGVNRSVQTGDAGHMNAYAIASILSILTLAGWAVSYKER